MEFGFLGVNYKKAGLDIRDQTSFTDAMKLAFFQQAEKAGVDQCMVLSTCNRSEVYYFYSDTGQPQAMRRIYQDMFSQVSLSECLSQRQGRQAMAGLFRIAAGLESLVLGEDQILGQVKEAADFARTMGYSKKELNRVVRDAVTCAKKIKTELRISERPLSVGYVGIRRLDELCGIAGKRVLLIGSGKTAVLALRYLYDGQAGLVTVCSRTLSHAARLRGEFPQMRVIGYEQRYEEMAACDIVVTATASPHLVVRREEFQPARPITFLDLAAPRDVDMALAENPLVCLINLDSLQTTVQENLRERERLVEESRRFIEQALDETEAWLMQSRMDSTICSLQQRCGEIVEDSFSYLNRKMTLTAREQKLLRKVLNASLQRLLREPIQELKHLQSAKRQDEIRSVVEQLFQLGQQESNAPEGEEK